MEDFVTDTEASVLPLNKEEDHEKDKEKDFDDKKAHKKEGHFFSRLIYGEEAEAKKEVKEEQRGIVELEGKEEGKSGGIITNFISNFVSPLSPKTGQVTEQKHEVDEIEKGDSKSVENGGGIINNLISNLFHQSNEGGEKREGDKEEEEEENMNFVGGRKKAKVEKEGEEREGIIDSIVSHLPTLLPDDAAPTTNEASILIHSIVKD